MEVTEFSLDKDVLVQFSACKYLKNDLIDTLNILIKRSDFDLHESFKERTRISYKLLRNNGIPLDKAIHMIDEFIGRESLVTFKGKYYYFELLELLLDRKLGSNQYDIIEMISTFMNIEESDDITLQEAARIMNVNFDKYKWHNSRYDVSIIEKIWFKLKSMNKLKGEKNE
ncbi:MAG: hypothetical protein ACRC4L_01925 [Mycoplasma sp.]